MDTPRKFNILFRNPPGPDSEFVEIEDSEGKSIQVGVWAERSDGYWVLTIDTTPDIDPVLQGIANFVASATPNTAFEELQREVINQLVDWINTVRGKKQEVKDT